MGHPPARRPATDPAQRPWLVANVAFGPAGATAAATAEQGHSEAAKAWKNVLRSASSAAGARGAKGEPAREGSVRQGGRRSSLLTLPQ